LSACRHEEDQKYQYAYYQRTIYFVSKMIGVKVNPDVAAAPHGIGKFRLLLKQGKSA
jgi:hypothetical protein